MYSKIQWLSDLHFKFTVYGPVVVIVVLVLGIRKYCTRAT